jgi:hypothetical protein
MDDEIGLRKGFERAARSGDSRNTSGKAILEVFMRAIETAEDVGPQDKLTRGE